MIEWDKITYFNKSEFFEDPDLYADPGLIYALDITRDKLQSPIFPSPVRGALARTDIKACDSQHYVDTERKSVAIDVFCDVSPMQAWCNAIETRLWSAVGIYFDTYYANKSHCMFHLDRRKKNGKTILWLRNNHEYMYPSDFQFWDTFSILIGGRLR